MISKGTIRRFKRMSEQYMDCLATIYLYTIVRSPGAVEEEDWVESVADVPCRLTIADAPNQALTADQLRTAARWEVTMPLGTVVTEKSRVKVNGTDIDGNDFEVTVDVVVVEAPKSFAVHTKVVGTLVHPDGT